MCSGARQSTNLCPGHLLYVLLPVVVADQLELFAGPVYFSLTLDYFCSRFKGKKVYYQHLEQILISFPNHIVSIKRIDEFNYST